MKEALKKISEAEGEFFWAKGLWGNDGNGIKIVNSMFRKERRGTV